jgi:D-alanyl-lipoteichoic acid acyltransferase DltB (MBOAT superfamily)
MIEWLKYNPQEPLLFTRPIFWAFFMVVFGVFCIIHKKLYWRNLWLFATSVFFYFKSSGLFFSLIILSIVVNFFLGKAIDGSKKSKIRKTWLTLAVVYNLSWLVYFKYTYLFVGWINQLTGSQIEVHDWLTELINMFSHKQFDAAFIILPVGISFYTFQIISYIVDIYRNKIKPLKHISDFGFYVTFFPQLVAGPIVRASDFVPQIYEKFHLYKEEFGQGLFFILNGLIKKIVIADFISVNFVDRVFDNPLSYSGFENLMAVYGYSIQIYCDFSGYTDIAIGLALWMGFRLNMNFNSPYKATNITGFWHRWHISLSSWLKDYLYIPLGGNRKGKVRTYINLFITMLLGGLWHGANLRFVIWGALHGIYLAIHKMFTKWFKTGNSWHFASVFVTFHIVTFTWIPFRAGSLEKIKNLFNQIIFDFKGAFIFEILKGYWFIFVLMLLAYTIHWLPASIKNWYRGRFSLFPLWVQGIVIVLVIVILVQFTSAGLQPFIYFQF